jgi:hypothetical protein
MVIEAVYLRYCELLRTACRQLLSNQTQREPNSGFQTFSVILRGTSLMSGSRVAIANFVKNVPIRIRVFSFTESSIMSGTTTICLSAGGP